MPATTTNISMTFNTAKNQDLTYGSATSNDKVLLLVFSGSSVILSKKSVNYGGSADEIAITASTKYTAKFTAADASAIPNNATYKAYLVASDGLTMEEIFNGTFTVTGTTVAVGSTISSHPIYSVREDNYSVNTNTTFSFPQGSVLLGVLLYASGGTPLIDISDSTPTVLLNDAQTVQGNFAYFPVEKLIASGAGGVLSLSSADWETADVNFIFLYITVDL